MPGRNDRGTASAARARAFRGETSRSSGWRDCEISRLLRHAATLRLDAELLHAAAERAWIQPQEPGSPSGTVNHPARLLQDLGDVSSLDFRQRDRPPPDAFGRRREDDLLWKVEGRTIGEDHRPLDDVLELSDVSGPVIGLQPFQGLLTDALE